MEIHHILMLFFSTFGFFFFSNAAAAGTNLFREYIGAESAVHFSAVPINSGVDFHFILAFAIDYTTTSSHPTPTNGNFNPFWNTDTLTPTTIASLKSTHPNARVAVSLGGDSVTSNQFAYFSPTSTSSWVTNAAASLTQIIQHYNLDGIDIDYEHFKGEPNTFADCIGQLVQKLKGDNIISFASIAPYEDDGPVQRSYMALWRKYGDLIDYVNFQFYAYDKGTSVQQFLQYFENQRRNYNGGQLLASFISDGSLGLGPQDGFFDACGELKGKGWLGGIFVWCADESQKLGFKYEKQAQQLLASS